VIVLVARDHVEEHAAKLLLEEAHRQLESLHHIEGLLVGVYPGRVEIKMGERGE